jgi:hypothetical protein
VIERERADVVVVGMPLTLRGERGEQAQETERFVDALRAVVRFRSRASDERFTTRLASGGGDARRTRAPRAPAGELSQMGRGEASMSVARAPSGSAAAFADRGSPSGASWPSC